MPAKIYTEREIRESYERLESEGSPASKVLLDILATQRKNKINAEDLGESERDVLKRYVR